MTDSSESTVTRYAGKGASFSLRLGRMKATQAVSGAVRFSSLGETTEAVRLQLGKRIRLSSPPLLPVAGSLVDRLDALIRGEQAEEQEDEQEWAGLSEYSEWSLGDLIGFVITALFVAFLLALVWL